MTIIRQSYKDLLCSNGTLLHCHNIHLFTSAYCIDNIE